MPDYLPFDPHPRAPTQPLPPLSCDSQFHVFGPRERYPVRAGAAYEMPSATIEVAMELHRTLGIERGVIVQATTYGADHRVVVDGLRTAGPNYRGCANAIVLQDASDIELARLHDAGVRGARFTRQALGVTLSARDMARAFDRIRELGWYAKIQPEPGGLADNAIPLDGLDMPVLIDHLGRPDPTAGDRDPSRRKMLGLLARGNFWVMVSLTEKISKAGHPWDDVVPIARAYLDAAPDRVVWGSDWPHPVSTKQPPNEGTLLDFLGRVARTERELRAVLVDNPARLFGFSA